MDKGAEKRMNEKTFLSIIHGENKEVLTENANMNSDTPSGLMYKLASETSKEFVVKTMLSEEAREAVETNHIHIHDIDYYPTKSLTCLQHPLDKILENGFRAGHGSSRPAGSRPGTAWPRCLPAQRNPWGRCGWRGRWCRETEPERGHSSERSETRRR